MAPPPIKIQPRLNNISHCSKIASPMRKLHTLRPRRRTTSVSKRNNIVLTSGLAFKRVPTFSAIVRIVFQALKDGRVKRSGNLTGCHIRVGVHNDRDTGLCGSVGLQERKILFIRNDYLGIGVGEDVGYVVFFETVVYRCGVQLVIMS